MHPIPIVPIPHLEELSGDRDRYLALSHLVKRSSEYRDFLKSRSDQGAFITLDNSAHEMGQGQPLVEILEQARQIGAKEIVLPDELFSFHGTKRQTVESFREIASRPEDYSGLQFMVVPQGRSIRSTLTCLNQIMKKSFLLPESLRSKVSIGISKDYYQEKSSKAFLGLIQLAANCVRDVHLLGWPLPLHHLSGFTLPSLNIRSTDSARAITYAMFDIDLSVRSRTDTNFYVYPKRPRDFFDRKLTPSQMVIAKKNLAFYYDLCRGRTLAVDEVEGAHV